MSLASGDLTTVANAKMWITALGGTTQSDVLIQQLITRTSAQIRSWLSRPYLLSRNYTSTFDGSRTSKQILPYWPVTAVSSVQVGNWIVPPEPLPQGGGVISIGFPALFGQRVDLWDGLLPGQPTSVQLLGGIFPSWAGQNIRVSYTAGYGITAEPQTVPSSPPYTVTVNQPMGICALDGGVTYANGTPLTADLNDAPGQGEYNPPLDVAPGLYTFSAADAGASVLISYSFIPADLASACEQAVTMQYVQISTFLGLQFAGMIGDMKVGDTELRAGVNIKISPETLFNPQITAACQPYRQVAPVRH